MAWIQIVFFAYLPWILHTVNSSAMDKCLGRGMFYCLSDKECISIDMVCDGVYHCASGEDEKHPFCSMGKCLWGGGVFCYTNQCIHKKVVCDGTNDCSFGEDESVRACTLKQKCESSWSLSEGCFKQCKRGYFGNYCENICPQTCLNRICNIQSGICTNCSPGYYGKYCVKVCSNECLEGICNNSSGICKDCITCYYGMYCDKTCPENCLNGTCNTSSGICAECALRYFGKFCEKRCSNECFNGICNSSSGICKDCEPGYFGMFCDKRCPNECLNGTCRSSSGICKDCKPGNFGKYCEKTCSNECLNGTCSSSSGFCKECKPGYFGKYCETTCSEECLNGICNSSSGICKDCKRTYLESCSLRCGQECRQRNGFPQCHRQSGKCLHGCYFTYGSYCNETCSKCKRPSSVVPCDIDGVCLLGCENDYWGKKCNTKCTANCQGDKRGNRCNSSTGECINGCTPGWSGRFCGDVSSLQTTIAESTDKKSVNSLKTTMIVISVIFTVVVVVVGSVSFLWARKGFIRQQNDRIEPGRVFPDSVPPTQQPSGSRRRQSSNVYAVINEETIEYYHYICEQNSPDNYDEINVGNDPDIEIVPLKQFTDENDSRWNVTQSEGKDDLDSTEETGWGVRQFNCDLNHVCKSNSGVNPRGSDIKSNSSIERVGTNDVLDLEAHCQTTEAENRQMQAAKYCNEGEDIFGDLENFQVDYIHAIASEECELLDNELDHQTLQSSL